MVETMVKKERKVGNLGVAAGYPAAPTPQTWLLLELDYTMHF